MMGIAGGLRYLAQLEVSLGGALPVTRHRPGHGQAAQAGSFCALQVEVTPRPFPRAAFQCLAPVGTTNNAQTQPLGVASRGKARGRAVAGHVQLERQ